MEFSPDQPAPAALFARAAQRKNEARFLIRKDAGWQAISWAQLCEKVECTAAYLLSTGIKQGDRIGLFAANSVAWASTALGIQAMGGILVPIYATSSTTQAEHVIDHAGVSAVFCDSSSQSRAGHENMLGLDDVSQATILEKGRSALAQNPQLVRQALGHVSPTDVGLLLYTSGTSGPPKGVPLTHANMGANGADWIAANQPLLHDRAVDILWLPMSHVFGFGELCMGNALGWKTYLSTPAEILDDLPQIAPTVFFSVPAYWEKMARGAMSEDTDPCRQKRLAAATGGNLRFCLSGGAGLKREIKELFYRSGVLIIEGYGLSECSPTLTLNRASAFRFDSVGKPLDSVELRLDKDGEILARGPNVFAGYYNDPQETRRVFTRDGWFRTGDIGRFTDDGFLQIVGRKKDILVTSGGKNIAPANIELRFVDHPLIEHLIVYGDGRRYLVAGVWPTREGLDLKQADLKKEIQSAVDDVNSELAQCETIKTFAVVREPLTVAKGHLTASLKIRRKHIYRDFGGVFEALYHRRDSRADTEHRVRWA